LERPPIPQGQTHLAKQEYCKNLSYTTGEIRTKYRLTPIEGQDVVLGRLKHLLEERGVFIIVTRNAFGTDYIRDRGVLNLVLKAAGLGSFLTVRILNQCGWLWNPALKSTIAVNEELTDLAINN